MTKRSPDKREQKRLKKIEDERQKKRRQAAYYVSMGFSYRETAKKVGLSHQFVMYWAHTLLEMDYPLPDRGPNHPRYQFRKGYTKLLETRKSGPKPGSCPKVDEIIDDVVAQAKKPFCNGLGAAKIQVMSGVDASAPTVRKALRKGGIPVRTRKVKTHRKRFCRSCGNYQWNIDFVEIGVDSVTGKKVESLSVTDDHSRMLFSADATVSATTEHVIEVLEGLINEYGCPTIINSDHGTQWYSVIGGESRFDT